MTPDLFRHKWREGMQQPQGHIEHTRQRICSLRIRVFHLQLFFGDFHIPIRKVAPDELIDLPSCFAILEGLEEPFHIADELLKTCPDPGVGESPALTISPLPSWAMVGADGGVSESMALITNRPTFQILLAKLRLDSTFLGPTFVSLPGR